MSRRSEEFPFSRPLWKKDFRVLETDFPELGSPGTAPTAAGKKTYSDRTGAPPGPTPMFPRIGNPRETPPEEGGIVSKGCSRWNEDRSLVQKKVPLMNSEAEFPELNPLTPEEKERQHREIVRKWIGVTPNMGKGDGWVEGQPEGLLGSGDDGYSWMSREIRSQLQDLYYGDEDKDGNEAVVSLPTKPCWYYTMGEPGDFDPKAADKQSRVDAMKQKRKPGPTCQASSEEPK